MSPGGVDPEVCLKTAALTVRRELVSLKHSDAEDVLLKVLDKKLTVGVPLRVQRVLNKQKQQEMRSTITSLSDET